MDWTSIILAIFGCVGTVDLLRLLFVKQDRKAKDVGNNNAELEIARAANKLLSEQLDKALEINRQKDAIIAEKDDLLEKKNLQIAKQTSTITALFDDMCVHKGCRVRKPHQGQGSTWYEKYAEDPNLGADYSSIDTLLKIERKNRLIAEKHATEIAETTEGE